MSGETLVRRRGGNSPLADWETATTLPTFTDVNTNPQEHPMNTNPTSSIPEGVQTLALDMARSYRTANSDEDRTKTDAHMSALIATVRRYGANHDDLMELARKMDELSGLLD